LEATVDARVAQVPDFEKTVAALRKVVESSVDDDIQFYKDHVRGPRLAAQLLTSATILLAATLPFLTGAGFSSTLTGVVSVLIAMLTGLTAYWRWTDEWRGYTLAQVTLEKHKGEWEVELIAASLLPPEKASQTAISATRSLVRSAGDSVRRETASHFATLLTPVDIGGDDGDG
jgi:hypothetical protein